MPIVCGRILIYIPFSFSSQNDAGYSDRYGSSYQTTGDAVTRLKLKQHPVSCYSQPTASEEPYYLYVPP